MYKSVLQYEENRIRAWIFNQFDIMSNDFSISNCQSTYINYNLLQVKLIEGKRLQPHHAKRLINCVKRKSHYASKLL